MNQPYAVEYAGACAYCWPGHDPGNAACPANLPENIWTDPDLVNAGAQYDLMLCNCQPDGGFAPIHPECERDMEAYEDFQRLERRG